MAFLRLLFLLVFLGHILMIARSDKLFEVRHKLKRAYKHIKDLKRSIEGYSSRKPYSLALKRTVEKAAVIDYIFEVTDFRPPPPSVSLIAGDAIQNMRASLDYLACLMSRNNRASFPIWDSASAYTFEQTVESAKMHRLKKNAIKAIRNVQPDQRGYSDIAKLHELSIIDKHRSFIVAAVGMEILRSEVIFDYIFRDGTRMEIDMDSTVSIGPFFDSFTFKSPIPLEKGAELPALSAAKRLKLKGNPNMAVSVTFEQPARVKGKMVYFELAFMHTTVQGVVNKLEQFVP